MQRREVEIANKQGLNARASTKLMQLAASEGAVASLKWTALTKPKRRTRSSS